MYWCCAQIEPFRERLAMHCLGLNGFEIYYPRIREQVRIRGRKIVRTPPLFPRDGLPGCGDWLWMASCQRKSLMMSSPKSEVASATVWSSCRSRTGLRLARG